MRQVFAWPSENQRSGASDHRKDKIKMKTRKAPRALDHAVVLPPPWGVKYVTFTQDKTLWPSENRRSGASDHQKKKTRKAPGALTPPLFSLPLGSKIYYGHIRYKPKWFKF